MKRQSDITFNEEIELFNFGCPEIEGCYSVKVCIQFHPMKPPETIPQKIEIDAHNTRLAIKADKLAKAIRQRLEQKNG